MKINEITNYQDIMLGISQFLDDFKKSKNKKDLIADEPHGIENKVTASLTASIVHKLANDNNIEIPQWVYKKSYILQNPTYAHDTKNTDYQNFLKKTSFPEFTSRNLFYGDNVIERK